MKTKVIIFDADGMVIKAEMFSDKLSREYNISLDEILPFFNNEFQLCMIGKADLKRELKKYLEKWKLIKPLNELLEEWFKFEDNVDKRIIKFIKKLQKKGIKCVLATNQEKYRTKYLLEEMSFDKIFDKVFSSAHIGYKKPEQEFYQFIYSDLKKEMKELRKEEILFWDDREKNIKGAEKFGFNSRIYKNFTEFENYVESF